MFKALLIGGATVLVFGIGVLAYLVTHCNDLGCH